MRLIDADFVKQRINETMSDDYLYSTTSIKCLINEAPTIDAVPKDEYKELLKAAIKMHLWIFLNTADEEKAYEECELTDEMNALLGYSGKFVINDDPDLYPHHGGAGDETD